MNSENTLDDDVLIGARAISYFLFGSSEYRFQRRIYYLTTTAKIKMPHFRLGQQLTARKSIIRAWTGDQALQEYGSGHQ